MPRAAVLSLLLVPSALAAQTLARGSIERAASSITADGIRRRISILADDSMRGRDTPSPELEKVATWVAAEFRRFGLRPGGDSGTYLQRYVIRRTQIDTAQTFLSVSRAGGGSTMLGAGSDIEVLRLGPPLPSADVSGPVVVLTGRTERAAEPLAGVAVRGAWILEFATHGAAGSDVVDLSAAEAAFVAGAVGLLVISDRSDAEWQAGLSAANGPTLTIAGRSSVEAARAPGLATIRARTARRALGLDLATLRTERHRSARQLPGVILTLRVRERLLRQDSAPNVIGILDGSDARLRNEYVFFTAHMDHLGVAGRANAACRERGGDSICNGADDNASGTTAVIEAAHAFSQLQPRPRRSLVFMTVSGEEKGLWGSEYFSEHPTVPWSAVVADVNSDMVGRNWRDTIAVIGKEQSDLGATLDRVAAVHPELRMTPIGDIWPEQRFYERSDHYNFARRGVPILFFCNGTHSDYHAVTDEVAKIDAEKESRIVKLVFYLGLEIADAAERPRWDPESYKRVVEAAN